MKDPPVFHPFLFAVLPTLAYFAPNTHMLLWQDMIPSAIVVLLVSYLLFLLLGHFLRDKQKAGLFTSLSILVFFGYGPSLVVAHYLLPSLNFDQFSDTPLALLFYLPLVAIPTFVLFKALRYSAKLTVLLNCVAVGMLLSNIVTIGEMIREQEEQTAQTTAKERAFMHDFDESAKSPFVSKPDIYWIVLDGCASPEVLSDVYNYEDPFSKDLRAKGFFIPKDARTNYPITYLSFASFLNGNYVNDFATVLGKDSTTAQPLFRMITENRTARILREHGYKIVNVGCGVSPTDHPMVDIDMSSGWASRFNLELVQSSVLGAFESYTGIINSGSREKRESFFKAFQDINRIAGPKFVFTHIYLPHPPFSFHEDGKPRYCAHINPQSWPDDQYLEQIKYTHTLVKGVIDTLLANKEHPSVIIVQGDHGPGMKGLEDVASFPYLKRRCHTLNAYYFPGKKPALYDDVTPVNSLRLLVSYLEGKPMPLLPDRSYFATFPKLYDLIDVTNAIPKCKPLNESK